MCRRSKCSGLVQQRSGIGSRGPEKPPRASSLCYPLLLHLHCLSSIFNDAGHSHSHCLPLPLFRLCSTKMLNYSGVKVRQGTGRSPSANYWMKDGDGWGLGMEWPPFNFCWVQMCALPLVLHPECRRVSALHPGGTEYTWAEYGNITAALQPRANVTFCCHSRRGQQPDLRFLHIPSELLCCQGKNKVIGSRDNDPGLRRQKLWGEMKEK